MSPARSVRPDDLEGGLDPLGQVLAGQAVHPPPEAQVLQAAGVWVEGDVLGHVADGRLDLAGVAVQGRPGHRDLAAVAAQGASQIIEIVVVLPAPLGPARRSPRGDLEPDAVDGQALLEALAQVLAPEHRRSVHGPSLPPGRRVPINQSADP